MAGAPFDPGSRAAAEAQSLPDDARLIDMPTIVAASGTSLRTARYWVATGQLRVTKLGRSLRVRVSDWRAFLDARSR